MGGGNTIVIYNKFTIENIVKKIYSKYYSVFEPDYSKDTIVSCGGEIL